MTPHETTPTLAPARERVERWAVVRPKGDYVWSYASEAEAQKGAAKFYDVHQLRIARMVELRPGDLLIREDAREGAVERAAEALHEWERMGDREIVEWAKQGERRRNYCRQRVIAIYGALARPSGEEGR